MTRIVILAEEPSGRIVAEHLAQKLNLIERTLCLEHQGKGDLDKSFPRKIGHWGAPQPPRFIVMRDNDGANCMDLKAKLLELVPPYAVARVKIRLVIQELESWYLGDLDAIGRAGLLSNNAVEAHKRKANFRNPDQLRGAKQFFKRLIGNGGQIALARTIAPHLSLTDNRSRSFHAFLDALRWGANEAVA